MAQRGTGYVGAKAQGGDNGRMPTVGSKEIAWGVAHTSRPMKRRIRRSIERRVRQAGRKECDPRRW